MSKKSGFSTKGRSWRQIMALCPLGAGSVCPTDSARRPAGFSILEILVALSIVGIVAGISVPNYTKMKRSAKKAEAQSSLGQIYIAEKAFFLQWRYYTVDLTLIGAVPEGPMTYNAGFHGSGVLNPKPSNYRGLDVDNDRNNFFAICGQEFGATSTSTGTTGTGGGISGGKQCAFSYKKGGEYKGFEPPDIPDKTKEGEEYDAKKDTFIAGAIANLINREKNSPNNKDDIWSINQFKQFKRECGDDCPY